jgi:hypothetical protein
VEVLFQRVAGLDIGKATLTVCMRVPGPAGGRVSEVRTYPTMTRSLQAMRDWLVEYGVTIAVRESTSTYWKPPFYCLEEVMETWLLNAAHIKAVPGRKTDVKDSEWIAQLLEHGLLSPSFVPPPEIRRLRMLTRYRVQPMGGRRPRRRRSLSPRARGRDLDDWTSPGQGRLHHRSSPRPGTRARDAFGGRGWCSRLCCAARDPGFSTEPGAVGR